MSARFQFGVGQLLWAATVVAVVAGIAGQLQLTATAAGLLAGYLGVLAVWLVVRGPAVVAGFRDLRRRRQALRERRRVLHAEVAHLREQGARPAGERPNV